MRHLHNVGAQCPADDYTLTMYLERGLPKAVINDIHISYAQGATTNPQSVLQTCSLHEVGYFIFSDTAENHTHFEFASSAIWIGDVGIWRILSSVAKAKNTSTAVNFSCAPTTTLIA